MLRNLLSKKNIISVITDETKRKMLQYICVFLFLGFVSAFMTVFNILNEKGSLTVATSLFSLLCLVNYILTVKGGKKGLVISAVAFMVEIVVMLTFFVISGNPDGFSAIWVAMLPACGMLLFGKKRASYLCLAMLAILIFFFWVPAGRALLQFGYNETFMMRFPILYIAFFLLSALLETIREITQRELDRLRDTYKYLSAHDYLTNMLNRTGLAELRKKAAAEKELAVFMIDIDFFKNVNDSYGHDAGDLVLARVAEEIAKISGNEVCRWGGEEFVVWFPDAGKVCDPEKLRKGIEALEIALPNSEKMLKVTVSIGAAKGADNFDMLVKRADELMYQAKQNGRNQAVSDF
ncbi:MAG: GGDEF domain-containing protein [Clostridia bacterium]|nr:GGDEF domain-containing protein [Clostridia bacterium]